MKKFIIVIGTYAILAASLLLLLKDVRSHLLASDQAFARNSQSPMPVQALFASTRTLQQIIGASAVVTPSELIKVYATQAGQIDKLNTELGSQVHKGQLLVHYNAALAISNLERAKVQHETARDDVQRNERILTEVGNWVDRQLLPRSARTEQQAVLHESRAQFIRRRLQFAQAQNELLEQQLRSTSNGIITELPVSPNLWVRRGEHIATIANMNPVEISIQIPVNQLDSIQLGATAKLELNAFPKQELTATVIRIADKAEAEQVAVIVSLNNPEFDILPGMSGRAVFELPHQALTVPSIALVNRHDQGASIFVVREDGRAHLTPVKVGGYADGFIAITEGLKPGELVVVVGQQGLKDFDNVRIGNEPTQGHSAVPAT